MKKFFKVIAVLAFAAIIGFSLTGCSDGGDKDGGTTQPVFSVSGEFNGAANGKALFKAKTAENRSARAAVSTYELTGELEDGDMVFRLKGTYDSSDGSYIVSSASSFARYTVNGNANGATATLAVKDSNDEWKSFVVSVTIKEVSVKDGDVQDTAGGLPEWARGSWHHQWSEKPDDYNHQSSETWSYFDQWYFEAYKSSVWRGNWDFTATKYTVIEVDRISDDEYDVIFSYPFYKATRDQKMAALKQFCEEKKITAEPWNYEFAPWDQTRWEQWEDWEDTEANEKGMNYNNSVIWYICMEEKSVSDNHEGGGLKIINWDTFYKFFVDKYGDAVVEDEVDENGNNAKVVDKEIGKVYGSVWGNEDRWGMKNAVEACFKELNIPNYYYYGWHEEDWEAVEGDSEKLKYSCWRPVCEDVNNDGSWWNTVRYFSEWGNQTGFQGDWTQYGDIFQKWDEENYLITYLISKGVEPTTWYTRVKLTKTDYGVFLQYYYDSENSKSQTMNEDFSIEAYNGGFYAPPCDKQSLSGIKALTFDQNYLGWSMEFKPQ